MHHVQTCKVLGIDTETTGLDPLQDEVRLVQVATNDYPTLIFDMWGIDQQTKMFLQELMAGHWIKVFQNAKFDMKSLQQAELPVAGRIS